jgi:predicted small lipoprotein YifL
MTRIRIFPLLLLTLALCACGNKGPLVHPPPEDAPEAPSAAASDAGAEADPVPVDDVPVPPETEPVPAETEPATPPDDTTDDEPPGDG